MKKNYNTVSFFLCIKGKYAKPTNITNRIDKKEKDTYNEIRYEMGFKNEEKS